MEQYVVEFWDNSREHKDDIINFIYNKPQTYLYGSAVYWMGSINLEPFCFIVSDILKKDQDLTDLQKLNMSKFGNTIAIDFCIGNKKFLGKGLASDTLASLVKYYHNYVDSSNDTFL